MAWRWPGTKPLSEPIMVRLPMHICVTRPQWVNILRPKPKWPPFRRWHFQMHFLEWKCMNITSDFTLKFVPMVGINNILSLVQMMAWRWPGNKPSFESTTASLLRNIWVRSQRCGCLVTWFCYHLIAKPGNKTAAPLWPCITRPQWVKTSFKYSDSDSDKVYSTKIYTSTISGLHEFLRNTNNTIVLIYK